MKTELNEDDLLLVARIVHETMRSFASAHGADDIPSWDEAPEWMHQSTFAGIRFRLDKPGAPDGAQHDQWMEEKLASGWSYGAVKDPEAKTHPMLIPFNELPEVERRKDRLFSAVVDALTDPV